jgi:hypothetical protein
MMRFAITAGIAVLAFSTMVYTVALAMTARGAQAATVVLTPEEFAVNWEWHQIWPAPKAPFDETPITPIESTGAPMFE